MQKNIKKLSKSRNENKYDSVQNKFIKDSILPFQRKFQPWRSINYSSFTRQRLRNSDVSINIRPNVKTRNSYIHRSLNISRINNYEGKGQQSYISMLDNPQKQESRISMSPICQSNISCEDSLNSKRLK